MGAARKYAVIDPATGKLDRRIFSDQAIYDDEMEKIFGRAWLMIGHESLVPAADNFFYTYMGEDPVILTRWIPTKLPCSRATAYANIRSNSFPHSALMGLVVYYPASGGSSAASS